MAVQLYKTNQVTFGFYTNPVKTFPEIPIFPLQKIKAHFSENNPVTEKILEYVEEWLLFHFRNNKKRYQHSISTGQTAEEIARIIGYINPSKAKLVGMIHDIAKDSTKKIVKNLSQEKLDKLGKNLKGLGIKLFDSELVFHEVYKDNVKNLHAPVGRLMAEKKLGIQDFEILNAIRYHTIGMNVRGLDTLSKVILLADKIEPVKRDLALYNEIMDVLRVTKNPDIALNALRNRLQQAA